MDETQEKPKRRFKLTCYGVIITGCCCLVICFVAFVGLMMYGFSYTSFKEHLPTSDFAPKATNYSEYISYLNQYREFDISKTDFLKWCQQREWNPVLIEELPEMPPLDWECWRNSNDGEPRINDQRDIPLRISRYCGYYSKQPKHQDCSQFECKIDLTGLTDDSCCRVVSKGYYYDAHARNGGGIYILYDFSNGRCYWQSAHH